MRDPVEEGIISAEMQQFIVLRSAIVDDAEYLCLLLDECEARLPKNVVDQVTRIRTGFRLLADVHAKIEAVDEALQQGQKRNATSP